MGIFEILEDETPPPSGDSHIKSFNTGLAKSMRLPGMASDFFVSKSPPEFISQLLTPGAERVVESPIPDSGEMQQLGADYGMAHEAGQEPEGLSHRIAENVGASVPFAPLVPFTAAAIITEALAIGGGAWLGQILEKDTEFGQKHPQMARA
ncbi:MAG: hypothetical protein DRI71_05840, partial [Bacteroidetes bacterium]